MVRTIGGARRERFLSRGWPVERRVGELGWGERQRGQRGWHVSRLSLVGQRGGDLCERVVEVARCGWCGEMR